MAKAAKKVTKKPTGPDRKKLEKVLLAAGGNSISLVDYAGAGIGFWSNFFNEDRHLLFTLTLKTRKDMTYILTLEPADWLKKEIESAGFPLKPLPKK